MTNFREDNLI